MIPGFGFLADLFTEPYLVKWEIADGVARSAELPGVAVPEDMFAGVVGVAPSPERLEAVLGREEQIAERGGPVAEPAPQSAIPPVAAAGLRTIPPREIGGNLDVRQLVAGSRLYLPVDVPGALFSDRRPPLRTGRRRGVRDGDRGGRVGHRGVPRPPRSRAARAVPDVRDTGASGTALVRHDGHPRRRRDGSHGRRPRGAAAR